MAIMGALDFQARRSAKKTKKKKVKQVFCVLFYCEYKNKLL